MSNDSKKINVSRLQVVNLQDNDILVLKLEHALPAEWQERMCKQLQELANASGAKNVQPMILSPGIDLEVVRGKAC